ncbi:CFI-box-CTERM domain-containing protein, partial [Rufibacter sp. XAAS-G3-1]|uniref:CFI-box-CTERM domain-containing protein n=1 Tax=Rufibacter sp. XAAS-G3-1 TaxID=2729134 RepID=UPI001C63B2EE
VRANFKNNIMKYYSEFTTKYVQDICDALTEVGIVRKGTQDDFTPDDFETLTDFLQNYVVMPLELYTILNSRGLVNRGRCPYTGETIDRSSPSWTWMNNRQVYVSNAGLAIMKSEDDADFEKVMGRPAPPRNSTGKTGCYIATVCYESEYAPEVINLKKYRDTILQKSILGKAFVKLYYFMSPTIANWLKDKKTINSFIRIYILDLIVTRISKK